MRTVKITLLLMFGAYVLLQAQPPEFTLSNCAGPISGRMTSYAKLSEMPDVFAGPGDYVAAFDPRGNCVGVKPVLTGGLYRLDIYGQNIVAGVGMANGENFRLVVWNHNNGFFYTTASTIPVGGLTDWRIALESGLLGNLLMERGLHGMC